MNQYNQILHCPFDTALLSTFIPTNYLSIRSINMVHYLCITPHHIPYTIINISILLFISFILYHLVSSKHLKHHILHLSSFKHILISLIIIIYIHPNIATNTWYLHTSSDGALWQSTSAFVPVEPKAYGNITIGAVMSMEFDFIFKGRTNSQLDRENFFRVGGDAKTYGDGCQGEGSQYPSLWLAKNVDTLYVSVTSGHLCDITYDLRDYGLIDTTTSYHIKIEFDDSILQVSINDNWNKTWDRLPTQPQDLGRIVDVWWSSNKANGTFSTAGGIFTNVTIISSIFHVASTTSEPNINPTTTSTNTHSTISTSTHTPTTHDTINPTLNTITTTITSTNLTTTTTSGTNIPTDDHVYPITSSTVSTNTSSTVSRSQIKAGSFDNVCNFTCWQCLQEIDIIGNDGLWDFMFHAEDETNCICPQQTALRRNNRFIDIGQSEAINTEYYLEVEKYIMKQDEDESDIEYPFKITVLYWNREPQNCSVLYFVNENEFFGVYAQNILTITFLICDVSDTKLTAQAIQDSEDQYTQFFAVLFDVNHTEVDVTIDIGRFCSKNNAQRRLLQDKKDQKVTVVIIFSDTEDARAAEQNACDEVEQQFPDIEADSCTVNSDADDYDDEDTVISEPTDIIFGLDALHIAMIIASIVLFCIVICSILYCCASHKKRKRKESLEMKYRKRTLSGNTAMNGVVTQGKGFHHKEESDEIQRKGSHEISELTIDKYALKHTDVSCKSSPGMNTNGTNLSTPATPQWNPIESNTSSAQQNTPTHGVQHSSQDSLEMNKFDTLLESPKNTLPTATATLSGNGSPYTLLASYTESDTFGNREYKSEKDMIEEVVNAHKAHEIKYADLSIGEKIGKGQFGAVYRAIWEGNVVVVKQLNNADVMENDSEKMRKRKEGRTKEMKAEIILASSMPKHNNLVEIFGYIRSPFGVVMSFMAGDSVQKYVYRVYKKKNDSIPRILEVLIILGKAASGLKFLHSYGLVHRDIACRNILLGTMGENGIETSTEVRISDFGLTRELVDKDNDDYTQKTKATFGPLKWMAPESIKARKYSKKSDVYMFGITMWEIFYGMEPYINMSAGNVAIGVVTKGIRPEIIDDPHRYRHTIMPQGYQALMKHCWQHQPEKRPSFADIIDLLTQIEENPV